MDSLAVINASPLIFLSRGRHLEILRHIAEQIIVPYPVAAEIRVRGHEDITVRALEETSWIKVVPSVSVPDEILEWGLGVGESSVLALALEHAGATAVIDDLSGRKCGASLGISVRGTLGIVPIAKRRGIIPSARAVVEDLIRGGLYLSQPVLDKALERVGE